ncbi:MAG: hypothetical protein UX91_C0007G0020 [Candidatus Amesbacteria bacterium GW2011_GWB1_47_19]|nr:MAG: hypothetical protein UW51_C0006G0159 [Candidatus Amesbacteria bacterium GW2011_GWA1_44_24]KKU31804.1 MAG: hypothetical protein UX46_C0002G0020 [Candidatus Amesbacteria bacterium GW2011_GWC1_46_24]KKU66740.1 MAG: hypothetical protein UX91_C0007G0020 [Candidatus Amesbacteria bacterium GW2011_GWB1_47_19]HBC73106.1 hypothetical protein [Candidatus Amesbacteria bacterium]
MLNIVDLYYLAMAAAAVAVAVFASWFLYEGVKTLRGVQDIMTDVKGTTRDLTALKDGVKGALMLASSALAKWQRGGGDSGRSKK